MTVGEIGRAARGNTQTPGPLLTMLLAPVSLPDQVWRAPLWSLPSLPWPNLLLPLPFCVQVIYHPINQVIKRKNNVLIIASLLCELWASWGGCSVFIRQKPMRGAQKMVEWMKGMYRNLEKLNPNTSEAHGISKAYLTRKTKSFKGI